MFGCELNGNGKGVFGVQSVLDSLDSLRERKVNIDWFNIGLYDFGGSFRVFGNLRYQVSEVGNAMHLIHF